MFELQLEGKHVEEMKDFESGTLSYFAESYTPCRIIMRNMSDYVADVILSVVYLPTSRAHQEIVDHIGTWRVNPRSHVTIDHYPFDLCSAVTFFTECNVTAEFHMSSLSEFDQYKRLPPETITEIEEVFAPIFVTHGEVIKPDPKFEYTQCETEDYSLYINEPLF